MLKIPKIPIFHSICTSYMTIVVVKMWNKRLDVGRQKRFGVMVPKTYKFSQNSTMLDVKIAFVVNQSPKLSFNVTQSS